MGIFDVPAGELIEAIAADLVKNPNFKEPAWTVFVKSGKHRERAPQRKDWWFVRAASILYRIYKEGPLGTESLRSYYGGKRNRGVRPKHFTKASGKVIRTCLQALEKDLLIKRAKPKGREIAPKGEKLLNEKAKIAFAVWQDKVNRATEIKAEKKKKRETMAASRQKDAEFKKFERRERIEDRKEPKKDHKDKESSKEKEKK